MPPSPAQMNGMNAHCPRLLSSSKVLGMDSVLVFTAMARVTTDLRPTAEDRAPRAGVTLAPAKAEALSACAVVIFVNRSGRDDRAGRGACELRPGGTGGSAVGSGGSSGRRDASAIR